MNFYCRRMMSSSRFSELSPSMIKRAKISTQEKKYQRMKSSGSHRISLKHVCLGQLAETISVVHQVNAGFLTKG